MASPLPPKESSPPLQRVHFFLLGVPPDQAAQDIEVDPTKTVFDMYRPIYRAYRLAPVFIQYPLVWQGQILDPQQPLSAYPIDFERHRIRICCMTRAKVQHAIQQNPEHFGDYPENGELTF